MADEKQPHRFRVVSLAWLGCSAAAVVAACVGAAMTSPPQEAFGSAFRRGVNFWLGMQSGPFAALLTERGFLATPGPLHYPAWAAVLALTVVCVLAHPVRPGRRSAIVSTLGVVLWFFLALVLGMWHI